MNSKLFIFISLMAFISCAEEKTIQPAKPWIITDVTSPSKRISVLIDKEPQQVSLKVSGEVDGNFRLLLDGADQNNTRLFSFQKGIIDTVFYQPWRAASCELQYRPADIQNGKISIELLLLAQ